MDYTNLHPIRFFRLHPFARDLVRRVANDCSGGVLTEAGLERITTAVMEHYNDALDAIERDLRPSSMDVASGIIADVGHLASFAACGRNTFVISDDLLEMFLRTDLSGVHLSDIRFPYQSFHIAFPSGLPLRLPGSGNAIDGVYVETTVSGHVSFYFTARRPDAERLGFVLGHEPHFFAPLPSGCETLAEALEGAIKAGDIDLEEGSPSSRALLDAVDDLRAEGLPVEAVTETGHDRAAKRNRDALPAIRRALAVVGNALCYLSSQPIEQISEEQWPGATEGEVAALSAGKGRKSHQKARGELLKKGLMPIRVLRFERATGHRSKWGFGAGAVRAHWRRGHWRRQRHGEGLAGVRLVWIRPTLVNQSAPLDEAERLYIVDDGEGSP